VPGKISFTLDAWTSPNCISFLGITAHWISKEWKLKEILVDFHKLLGSHSGENLADAFVKSCKEFNIFSKVFIIILFLQTFFYNISLHYFYFIRSWHVLLIVHLIMTL